MSAAVIGLALFAAMLHASWNAVLRTGADRLWTVTVMSFAMTAIALPVALALPGPPPSAWPYLILSSSLQVGYSVFLVAAYRSGELGQVYPIVRGSVPLLVTLGGFVLAGQPLSPGAVAGVVLVALGIMSLSLGKGRATTGSIVLALTTGLFIAGYTTVDAIGVREAGNPIVYAAWISLIYGVLLPAAFALIRGKPTLDLRSPETLKALAGGVVSLLAYGAVVAAFALGPVGPISALRETSVVFAALIGRLFLGETLTLRRVGACAVVALGAICLGA
ncbi:MULTISPECIES: DMT family transporter [Inquilinus]|uniref:Drug/metabolite transporter (DMT)-like permease n=1 Tax=Inquilinus ginsengisoli TaxID=363840 RepID=A0ABU1K0M1_9PROT|nr:DMT family transporter [Inquilinus ginsengisoli]MDR6293370.1 drug/metabolite transporter (DMT)-like permease [Inquilinus ginsengisoli]